MNAWNLRRVYLQLSESVLAYRRRLVGVAADDDAPNAPAELFSADQLERHGRTLAGIHRLSTQPMPDRLLNRLADNETVLLDTCKTLTAAVEGKRAVAPAGEWMLDNFYLIEEQIRTAKRHFPKGYSRELPRLARGPSAGLPRVYDIALEAIAHGDGRVDAEGLSRFVRAYQEVTPLKLGELWAIPIMLRLALIENLRRVGARVASSTIDQERADNWADWMMRVAERDPKSLIVVVADMARSNPPMASSFVAELARRLQGQSSALALPLTWIEQRLAESGLTIENLVQSETQKQAASQLSISNSIGSLRFFAAMDWREFVETMSGVEHLLQQDPHGVYGAMDFATRDSYRHVVERVAKLGRRDEIEVARQALNLARTHAQLGRTGVQSVGSAEAQAAMQSAVPDLRDICQSHVGYYLIGSGRRVLRRALGLPLSAEEVVMHIASVAPLRCYLANVTVLTLILTSGLAARLMGAGLTRTALVGILLLVLLSGTQLAISIVNWLATLLVTPSSLPRMDFSKGVPEAFRTLVVVPAMLGSASQIDQLLETLLVHFIANQEHAVQFGLLTDFLDADSETLATDAALLEQVRAGIADMNARHAPPGRSLFFLFHRPRRWNAQERRWMGVERKRGKLAALNAFLRGAPGEDGMAVLAGDASQLDEMRYVITLDADTNLPRDAARQFIGTMAHPLNQPHFDPLLRRVTAGYGILQPRVAVSLPSTSRSAYARIFGHDAGIDPYTRAVSDVYQDLFAEGSFIGKGIYDIDAFEATLRGRLPRNRILSHDLLEGCYARSGLLSDVLLYEDFPSDYLSDVRRRARWIRGDWQIATWSLPRVPGCERDAEQGNQANPLSALSRWKVLDNLRRSLVPFALVVLLVLGWTVLASPAMWTAYAALVLFLPPLLLGGVDLAGKPEGLPWRAHLNLSLRSTGRQLLQTVFALACLLHEACYTMDAILRTHWRMVFSHRGLLEWATSVESTHLAGVTLPRYLRAMWLAPCLAFVLAFALQLYFPLSMAFALPILLLWAVSPVVAWRVSQPIVAGPPDLSRVQQTFLRHVARTTWSFFETYVVEEDHFLPPDNFQEYPVPVVAHRTSPTNIGLALLANLAAFDFAYLAMGGLLRRTAQTFATLEKLERHAGHFYNWYDTQSLQPLRPLYISSVDSGNLAAHLLTLRSGLDALRDEVIPSRRWYEGLEDTLNALSEHLGPDADLAQTLLLRMQRDLLVLQSHAGQPSPLLYIGLTGLLRTAHQLAGTLPAPAPVADWTATPLDSWTQALVRQLDGLLGEFTLLLPWLTYPAPSARLRAAQQSSANPTLRRIEQGEAPGLDALHALCNKDASPEETTWLRQVAQDSAHAAVAAQARRVEADRLGALALTLAQMKFGFLYDRSRHLLSIGCVADERRQDQSYYDMLASEARLTSFLAIAQGQLPQEHWFALGRLLTNAGGAPALLSWSGSMFEYLMPLLVMPTYANTLLDSTYQAVVAAQIQYGVQNGVAWGVSESGYNAVDSAMNYQYRAFGVPGLGLKAGLAEDLVIAPYATALALMVAPEVACQNLQRLAAEGMFGRFGFYEAIDHTQARLSHRQDSVVIRSFMAHHQGMTLLSIAYRLLDQPMQKRFVADPMLQATLLLLQERIPRSARFHLHTQEFSAIRTRANELDMPMRVIISPYTPSPEVQLLSNSHYHVMVSNAGGGYSRWRDCAITRWREDPTTDRWGTFCYLRDVETGQFWSNTHQPVLRRADSYEAIFAEGRAEFRRTDLEYETYTEIVVSPEDDAEVRRVHITNKSRSARVIEVTTYAEVVLAPAITDDVHPAFSNLFVETEIIESMQAILSVRRPRTQSEQCPVMVHLVRVRGAEHGVVSYETDRARFIGRGRTASDPAALTDTTDLSNSAGSVLDPIVAIRHRILIEAQTKVTLDIVYGIAASRTEALALAGKFQDRHLTDRVFELAWTHSQVVLRQINANEADAQLYARLAGSVIYANPGLRADPTVVARNRRCQSGLWGYSISGDLPVALVQIGDSSNIDLVRQMVQAHAYWRLKGLSVDLVIWNEDRAVYRQLLQDQITGLISAGVGPKVIDRPGGIFVCRAEQLADEDRILIQSVARVIVSDRRGTLSDQVTRRSQADLRPPHLTLPRFRPTRSYRPDAVDASRTGRTGDLMFDNGIGGFTADGRTYVITTTGAAPTPAPWVNVLANAHFGSIISESGSAYTWSENAHEFRLTPWSNDPVTDTSGEAFYLRDEETGHVWSPTPLPARGASPYTCEHDFGHSRFIHLEDGIESELKVFVALDAPVKFSVLTVRNRSGRDRRLGATGYVEWVLGELGPRNAMHISTEMDLLGGAIYARNPYNADFGERVAFFDVDDPARTFTCDRTEFLGRNGRRSAPLALTRVQLSGKAGAVLDPCAAIQMQVELADGEEHEWIFRLGAGVDAGEARSLVKRWRGRAAANEALLAVQLYWRKMTATVKVDTPDAALNVLANGWLIYQVLASRFWARSGFYQSGGAIGFRDQLQDAMALIHADAKLVRTHVLRCAARQFREGDVQHWWHPGTGRGVRTQCSDDYLWLPLTVCRYLGSTGDNAVLDETSSFLESRPLAAGEETFFDMPMQSSDQVTLYEHCVRAIQRSLRFGAHGLPLMGSGDWNDGMDLVGLGGQGESVWLAFFLHTVLRCFAPVARGRGDTGFAARCETAALELAASIEAHGWDGEWYRRAYFDDGTPLGSASNPECQIDSLAQSWAVLSGVGSAQRIHQAMESLDRRLVRRADGLIQLLDPPFSTSSLNPGYIKGYAPGVRENGGQYTHAAVWTVMAFAELGDHARAWELFDMINPINHGRTPSERARYKVEPYVLAADVYAVAPHEGRGGWTWYTGSAGWMYRLITESLLGLRREPGVLRLAPCIPSHWSGFSLAYDYGTSRYDIVVRQISAESAATTLSVDGVPSLDGAVHLLDDGKVHLVELTLGKAGPEVHAGSPVP